MSEVIDIAAELKAYVKEKYGRQTHAARAWGVSDAFVSAVLTGRKNPTREMLEEAGFEAVFDYRRIQG